MSLKSFSWRVLDVSSRLANGEVQKRIEIRWGKFHQIWGSLEEPAYELKATFAPIQCGDGSVCAMGCRVLGAHISRKEEDPGSATSHAQAVCGTEASDR